MATTNDAMTIARNGDFQDRILYYMTTAAVNVMAEPGDTAGHAQRVEYAGKVLAGTANVFAYAVGVLTNPTLLAAIEVGEPDFGNVAAGDYQFVVNSLFGAFAGVST